MIPDILQAIGLLCGVAGAILTSGATAMSRRNGFAIWIASNAAWIAAAILIRNPYLFLMYLFYLITSVRGLWSNMGKKMREDYRWRNLAAGITGDNLL